METVSKRGFYYDLNLSPYTYTISLDKTYELKFSSSFRFDRFKKEYDMLIYKSQNKLSLLKDNSYHLFCLLKAYIIAQPTCGLIISNGEAIEWHGEHPKLDGLKIS